MKEAAHLQISISAEEAGQRLDRAVAANCPELSRTRAQELIEQGLVRLNGKAAKDSQKVRAGDTIEVQLEQDRKSVV